MNWKNSSKVSRSKLFLKLCILFKDSYYQRKGDSKSIGKYYYRHLGDIAMYAFVFNSENSYILLSVDLYLDVTEIF